MPVVSSSKQEFVFSRTCAGKRHLKSRERGDENEVYGEKTHEQAFCAARVLSSRPPSIYLAIIVFTSNAPNSSSFPVSPMMFSSISATYSLRPASEGCSFRVQRLALPPLS